MKLMRTFLPECRSAKTPGSPHPVRWAWTASWTLSDPPAYDIV